MIWNNIVETYLLKLNFYKKLFYVRCNHFQIFLRNFYPSVSHINNVYCHLQYLFLTFKNLWLLVERFKVVLFCFSFFQLVLSHA